MALTRQYVFGYDSKAESANLYSWSVVQDGNIEGKVWTCAYAPKSRGPSINIIQERMFLGGIQVGKTYLTFCSDLATDEGEEFVATVIFNNIEPTTEKGYPSEASRFLKIEFPKTNPLGTNVMIEVATDVIDPHLNSPVWIPVNWDGSSRIVGIPSGLGRSLNLRIKDETTNTGVLFLDQFSIHFIRLRTRQGGLDAD